MSGVWPAIVTQFDNQLEIDHEAVEAQVSRLVEGGVHGIVATGTMGEAASLSTGERRAVIASAVAAASGRVPVWAGVSSTTAEQACACARDAADCGARGLMSLPPLLYHGDTRELIEFFTTLVRSVDLPLMVYNNPHASGVDMRPELLVEIAHTVPNVVSIKECSGDARRIAELASALPEVEILVGGDDWALEGACAGAHGWISGVAVVLPRQCVRLWELCQAGELAHARELYAELLPLARLDMTPKLVQYFKAALDELNLSGGPCRPPRLALTPGESEIVRQAVADAASARV